MLSADLTLEGKVFQSKGPLYNRLRLKREEEGLGTTRSSSVTLRVTYVDFGKRSENN